MSHYMIQAAYTPAAAQSFIAKPQDRAGVIKKMVEGMGGKMLSFFFCFGEYDVVVIVEAPGNEAAVATGLAAVAGGALSKYRTTVLIAPEDAVKAMKMAKKIAYAPPK